MKKTPIQIGSGISLQSVASFSYSVHIGAVQYQAFYSIPRDIGGPSGVGSCFVPPVEVDIICGYCFEYFVCNVLFEWVNCFVNH
jgi:hypothetical protein